MAVKRDLSSLPIASRGNPPSRDNPKLVELMRGWADNYTDGVDMDLPHAVPDAGPYRASFAGARCNRALHYKMTKAPKSNEITEASLWNFFLGHVIGDSMHQAAERAWPGAVGELAVDLRPLGIPGSASADTAVPNADGTGYLFNIEYKSTGGFSFKQKTAVVGPEGPDYGAVVQGAMTNRGIKADKMYIMYFAKENISVNIAAAQKLTEIDRFSAAWEFSAEECDQLVRAEAARISRVLMFGELGQLPPRELDTPDLPSGAVVTDTDKGLWVLKDHNNNTVNTGGTWMCNYCDYQSLCKTDGPGGSETDVFI